MSTKIHLPVVEEPASSLASDGRRNFVHPADVSGRFTRIRYVVFAVLVAVYVALPFVRVGGEPAVFLDVAHRRFHLFGATFNATDFWLVFFLLSGVGFGLIVLTTLFGRVWCGYACPQTVFLEGVFRRIERLLEGPRAARMRRDAAGPSLEKIARKTAKHVVFATLCVLLGHVFLSYFVSLPSLWTMVRGSPSEHLEAFGWVTAFSLVTYLDFAWFREQLCLIICPYGRLQSALTDRDTLVIGYDTGRGEPRGKAGTSGAGDCVDCKRCVVVCPTGIDIRNGLQLDCIGCAACVDACDEVMAKLGRAPGLVRYDSQRGFEGAERVFFRPRVLLYAALGLVGLVVAGLAFRSRVPFEAHLLRTGGAGFVVADGMAMNPMRLALVNKSGAPMTLNIRARVSSPARVSPATITVRLDEDEARSVSLLAQVPLASVEDVGVTRVEVRPATDDEGDAVVLTLPFVGPGSR